MEGEPTPWLSQVSGLRLAPANAVSHIFPRVHSLACRSKNLRDSFAEFGLTPKQVILEVVYGIFVLLLLLVAVFIAVNQVADVEQASARPRRSPHLPDHAMGTEPPIITDHGDPRYHRAWDVA